MKTIWFVVLLAMVCVTASAQPLPQGSLVAGSTAPASATPSIAGRVIGADTGKPVSGVRLSLVSFDAMRVAKSAVSDANGQFEFTQLPAGRFQLSTTTEKYLGVQFGQRDGVGAGRPIDLREGQRFDKADFTLVRAGAIEGRLLDEFGDPVPNVTVQVARIEFAAGRRRLMPIGTGVAVRPTDDKGQFRISRLGPANYYLSVVSGAFANVREASGPAAGFAPTYYPGTTDVSAAVPIPVAPGAEVKDVLVTLVPAKMTSIAGLIVGESGRPVQATCLLHPGDQAGTFDPALVARGASSSDGRFVIRDVPVGSYTLQAFGPSNSGGLGRAPFGWASVSAAEAGSSPVTIRVGNVHARGRIVLDDPDEAPPDRGVVMLFPRPVEFDSAPIVGGGPPEFTVNEDWSFDIGNMSGLRVMRADIRPPRWTLKKVTLNGHDVTDIPIDFRKGDVNDLEVVLTTKSASVTGAVTTAAGQPASDYAVVVMAADATKWNFPSRFLVLGRPSQDGSFTIPNLPPEQYLAVPLANVRGSEWEDPQFLESIRSQAVPFTLTAGEKKTLTLKLVR